MLHDHNHFKLADIFFEGYRKASAYHLEAEFTQWFLDDLVRHADHMYDGQEEDMVREAVSYALYEWDL